LEVKDRPATQVNLDPPASLELQAILDFLVQPV